jgi:hypothetical protein
MATNFTVSRTIECWKKHTCTGCGGEYRYKFVRKLQAQGGTERKALDALQKKIESAVGAEVDMRPCPTCGRVQPDMVGQEKATAHTVVGVLALLICIAPVVLGATYVLTGNVPTFLVAGVLGVAALLQILVAFENHNRNTDKNLDKLQKYLDDGSLEQVRAGDTSQMGPGIPLMRGGVLIGLVLVLLSVVLALLPFGFQTLNGLAFNADTKPDVISPGDEVKLYFTTRIDCAKNYWRSVSQEAIRKNMPKMPGFNIQLGEIELPYAPPTVKIDNAAELGLPDLPIHASASDATWGQQMHVKNSQKHTHPWIWAKVTLPNDEKLAGKTIQLSVSLDVQYPSVSGDQFFTRTDNVQQTFSLNMARKGEGATYGMLWWIGLAGGPVLGLIGALVLRGSNSALKKSVPPPTVEVEDDEDDDANGPATEGDPAEPAE